MNPSGFYVDPLYWHNSYTNEKSSDNHRLSELFSLDYQDSNLDKQNQNLLCYHYTIVQTYGFLLKSGAKIEVCPEICKYFGTFFHIPILFCNNQIIVLLAALHQQILVIQ